VSETGDVVTNHHVLEGARRAAVKTNDGKIYRVEKIVADDGKVTLSVLPLILPGIGSSPFPSAREPRGGGTNLYHRDTPWAREDGHDGIVSAVREIPDFGRSSN